MLTTVGAALTCVGVACAILGSALGRPVLVVFGLTLSLYVAWQALGASLARVLLRSDLIQVRRTVHGRVKGGRVLLGTDLPVTITVENRLWTGLARVTVHDLLPRQMADASAEATMSLPPLSRMTLNYETVAEVLGPAHFSGVQITTTDPLDLARQERMAAEIDLLDVLPLPRQYGSTVGRSRRSRLVGQHRFAQKGLGSDLHEIRSYLPGDSLRKIAWKAVARTGRLLTREVESELTVPLTLVVDASQSMRTGPLGRTKLDYCLSTAAMVAAVSNRTQDPCGLGVFTDTGTTYVRPGLGRHHLVRLLDTLSATKTYTPPGTFRLGTVAAFIHAYVHGDLPSERVALSSAWKRGGALAAVAEAGRLTPEERYLMHSDPDYCLRRMLAFCRQRGIAIPPERAVRQEKEGAPRRGRDELLLRLMKRILLRARERELFAILSDFEGIEASPALFQAFRLTRSRNHSMVLLTPFTPWFETTGETDVSGTTRWKGKPDRVGHRNSDRDALALAQEMLALQFMEERATLRRVVLRLGIAVRDLAPEEMVGAVLEEVARLKHERAVRR